MVCAREQVMLEFGCRLQHDAWVPHLANCKDLARDVAVSCNDKAHCMGLGSEHLLDIPLGDLVATVERVDLVDFVHPRPAVKRAGDFLNVHLVTACLSGEARAVFDLSHLPDPPSTAFPRPPGYSKVCRGISIEVSAINTFPQLKPDPEMLVGTKAEISANGVSQLPLLPLDRLEKFRP